MTPPHLFAEFSQHKRMPQTFFNFDGETLKRCSKCGELLPLDSFGPNRNLSSGLNSRCRSCAVGATRQWRAAHPDYLAADNERRRGRYQAEHPHPTRPCVVCGEPFSKRPDALVCSERCRNRRKRNQRKRAGGGR